jgi:hypothetical protein
MNLKEFGSCRGLIDIIALEVPESNEATLGNPLGKPVSLKDNDDDDDDDDDNNNNNNNNNNNG